MACRGCGVDDERHGPPTHGGDHAPGTVRARRWHGEGDVRGYRPPRAGRPAPTSPTSTPSRAAPAAFHVVAHREGNSRYRHHTQAAQGLGNWRGVRCAPRTWPAAPQGAGHPLKTSAFLDENAGECCAQDMRLQVIRRASCSSGARQGCVPMEPRHALGRRWRARRLREPSATTNEAAPGPAWARMGAAPWALGVRD